MSMRRKLAATVVAASLFAFTAACGETSDNTDDDQKLVIGSIGTFSGPGAALGDEQRILLNIVVDSARDRGMDIEIIERDDAGAPDKAVAAARELVQNSSVDLVVGPTLSGTALAAIPVLNEGKVPNTSAAANSEMPKLGQGESNYFFRSSLTDPAQAEAIVRGAKELGYSKISIATDTGGYGQGGRDNLLRVMSAEGISPVADVTFQAGDTDLTAQMSTIKNAGTDVVVSWGQNTETAQLLRAAEQVGYDGDFVFAWAQGTSDFFELAGDRIDQILFASTFSFDEEVDNELAQDVLTRYREATKREPHFHAAAAAWFDSISLAVSAAENAETITRDSIFEGLLNLGEFKGLMANYSKPFDLENRDADLVAEIGLYEHLDGKNLLVTER